MNGKNECSYGWDYERWISDRIFDRIDTIETDENENSHWWLDIWNIFYNWDSKGSEDGWNSGNVNRWTCSRWTDCDWLSHQHKHSIDHWWIQWHIILIQSILVFLFQSTAYHHIDWISYQLNQSKVEYESRTRIVLISHVIINEKQHYDIQNMSSNTVDLIDYHFNLIRTINVLWI